jgi:glycosyltransferase involved in cell wall biosynthesis
MAAKRRIAFVANTSWSIYKFRLYLIERLLKEGYAILILAPRDAYTAQFEDIRGLTYIELSHMRGKTISPISDWRLYRELLHHYRTTRPHLIFHYTIKANIFGTLAAARAHIPSISVITGLGYTFTSKSWLQWAVKLLYRRVLPASTEVWFLNEDDRRLFISKKLLPAEKTFLLPGEGVDPDAFSPMPYEPGKIETTFLLIGRLIEHKGIYEFVEAAEQLKKQGLSVQCQLLGFFDEHNPVAIPKSRIASWVQRGLITYLGYTDQVAPFIARADCIVLPSYREGMPLSLLEGASMCKALIAADTPGCRSLIEEGVNGYLCREKDSEDLARKMTLYYHLPPSGKEKMGAASRQKILEHFTRDHITGIYLEKIEALAHSPVRPV